MIIVVIRIYGVYLLQKYRYVGENRVAPSPEFDSPYEEDLYERIVRIFNGLEVRTHPHFTEIFDVLHCPLSSGSKKYLEKEKTHIDVTIHAPNGQPLMCIEFDGTYCGFNRNGSYIMGCKRDESYQYYDKARKWKFDQKLTVAKFHRCPFYIISYPELEEFIPGFAIIDSLVGQTLAHVLSRSPFEWDPIADKAGELELELEQMGVRTIGTYQIEFSNKPELPPILSFSDTEGLFKRAVAMREADLVICTVRAPFHYIEKSVEVANYFDSLACPYEIAENASRLRLFHELAKRYGIKGRFSDS